MLTSKFAYRAVLVLLMILLLGSVSTIPIWVQISSIGRPVALLLLAVVVYHNTRNIEPVYSTTGRIVFFLLHCIILSAIFSLVWSIDPVETVVTVAGVAALLFIVQRSSTRRWRDRSVLTGDLKTMVWTISVVLLIGVIAHSLGFASESESERFQGVLNNPNVAAQGAALTLAIGWGIYREQRGWLNLVALLPSALTLVLTETRTTLLAVGIAVAFLLLRSGVRGILIGIGVGLPMAFIAGRFGIGPLEGLLERFGQESDGDAVSGRTVIWSSGIDLIKTMPQGTGWGTNMAVVEELGGFENYHNSFIHTGVEGGIIATLLIIAIYVILVLLLLRLPVTGLGAGISAAILAGIVIQFAESGVFGIGQPFPYLFWIPVGVALLLDHHQRDTGLVSPPNGTGEDVAGRRPMLASKV